MRILITGATGQLGLALGARLQGSGSLIVTDRRELDLSQPGFIAAALDLFAPDLVINAAAYTAVDKAEEEKELAQIVNTEAPGVMARWAAERRVPLIHFSTDYVFDGSSDRPWCEDDRPAPLSAYGKSKLGGEEAIRLAGGDSLIVRTSWVYAAKGSNFLRTIARLARERAELRVVNDQIGAPTSAPLVAGAIKQMLAGDIESFRALVGKSGGLVHLAAAGETSWHGFAEAILQGLRARGVPLAAQRVVPIPTKEFPTRAMRPANSRLNLERLGTIFGIDPAPWQEGLSPELDRLAAEADWS
jgi:dTDP-4-dehydrorhamnose reductase